MPTSLQIPSKVYIPGLSKIFKGQEVYGQHINNNLQIHQTFIRIQLTCTQF